jgi:hypothetical protein
MFAAVTTDSRLKKISSLIEPLQQILRLVSMQMHNRTVDREIEYPVLLIERNSMLTYAM